MFEVAYYYVDTGDMQCLKPINLRLFFLSVGSRKSAKRSDVDVCWLAARQLPRCCWRPFVDSLLNIYDVKHFFVSVNTAAQMWYYIHLSCIWIIFGKNWFQRWIVGSSCDLTLFLLSKFANLKCLQYHISCKIL